MKDLEDLSILINPFKLEVNDHDGCNHIPYNKTYNELFTADRRLNDAIKELWFRYSSRTNNEELIRPFSEEYYYIVGLSDAILNSIKLAINIIAAILDKLDISNYFGRVIDDDSIILKREWVDRVYIGNASFNNDILHCNIVYSKCDVKTGENINILECRTSTNLTKCCNGEKHYVANKNIFCFVTIGSFNYEKVKSDPSQSVTLAISTIENYINDLIRDKNEKIIKNIYSLLLCENLKHCSECYFNSLFISGCDHNITDKLDYKCIKHRLVETGKIQPTDIDNIITNIKLSYNAGLADTDDSNIRKFGRSIFDRYSCISRRIVEHSLAVDDGFIAFNKRFY